MLSSLFFFNDTATTEIYTLSLHDALPISPHCATAQAHRQGHRACPGGAGQRDRDGAVCHAGRGYAPVHRRLPRSEEHTSELQSRLHLVCRLLLEKKTPPSDAACACAEPRR